MIGEYNMREIYMENKSLIDKNMRKSKLEIVFYILMILNLGIGNISAGFLYYYTSTTFIVAVVSIVVIFCGLLLQFRTKIYFDSKLMIRQALFVFSSLITLLLNGEGILSILSDVFLVIQPLLLCILAITLTKKNNGYKFLTTFISVYSTWVSLQTIFMVGHLLITYGTISKSLLKVSIGGSNYIAAHLIVCFIYLILSRDRSTNKYKHFTIAITLIAIILTISFGALVSLLTITLLIMKKKIIRVKNIVILFIIGAVLIAILNGILINIADNNIFSSILLNINKKIQYLLEGNYTRLLAGRNLIYNFAIQVGMEKPIFGHSNFLYYFGVETRTHNWVIDSFITKGIVGTTFFISIVYYVMKRINTFIKLDHRLIAVKYTLAIGLIHGLVEPNFFSRSYDFLWWLIAGIAIGEIKKVAKNYKINTRN